MSLSPESLGCDPLAAVLRAVDAELAPFFAQHASTWGLAEGDSIEWPSSAYNKDTQKGDCFVQLGGVCGRARKSPQELVPQVAEALNAYIGSEQGKATCVLVQKAEAARAFLNIFLNRAAVYKAVVEHVQKLGSGWGAVETGKGQRVLIEHTSSNPNAPLHIGNLRNSIIGSVLAHIMAKCGYQVQQAFYVNDLGAQIGLTALGFIRVYEIMEPKLKIDQWCGMIYAAMNTLTELQRLKVDIESGYATLTGAFFVSGAAAADAVIAASVFPEDADLDGIKEYWDILWDLRSRQPELCDLLVKETAHLNIKEEAGRLNLAYERNEPDAVRIFRRMVIATLGGVQQTLDTYGVRHDRFDFESELGWEGSNDKVMQVMKASPYFVPQTQSNDKGVPEGAHLKLAQFIADKGLKTGKGGYMADYPNMYVLRPDGSTLYTYRDVVYSLKKEKDADIVLNVICAEQNLAQEKVVLSLELLHPQQGRKQYHMTYEVVKLLRAGKEVKMSGRRGRYVLADDLYGELVEALSQFSAVRASETEDEGADLDWRANVDEVLAAASMKHALLSCNPRTKINFDVAKVTNVEESSAPFLLYNGSRFYSLFRNHAAGVVAGKWPDQGPLQAVNWASIESDDGAWELLWNAILPLPSVVAQIGTAQFPEPPQLPEFPINLLIDHLEKVVRSFSRYWSAVKILVEGTQAGSDAAIATDARLWLLRTVHATLNCGLDMLTIQPLERM